MPLVPRRAHASLLIAVTVLATVVLACAPFGWPAPSASSSGASASAPAASADDPSGFGARGSAGAASSGRESPEVWLPEWADESLPEAVANRRPLRLCGIERPPAPQPMIFVDRIVRLCFQDAAEHGEEAEWVSIQGTIEGGTVATIYRVLRDGTVEMLTDWTQDPFGAGGWVRTTCRDVVDAEGDELIGVDGCDEAVPLP